MTRNNICIPLANVSTIQKKVLESRVGRVQKVKVS